MIPEKENKSEKKILGIFKKKEVRELTKEEIEREQNAPKNVRFFFKLLKRNFSKLLTLNFLMIFTVIPLIIAVFAYIQGPTTPSQTSVLAPSLFGAALLSDSPAVSLLQSISGFTVQFPIHASPVYIIIGAVLALLAITWGWQNVGATYVLRSMVRGEPVFIWSDFFYAIKRNIRQGFVMGLLDFIFIGVLTFDIIYFSGVSGSFAEELMFFCTIGLAIIYFTMRYYIYLMLITFDLSVFKLLKNALIFTALGIKRNIVATLGIVLMAVINIILVMLLMPVGVIVPLILPLVYFLPFASFITVYAAYPSIKKYMIDPQLSESEA
ncbi:MAG: DUF624 domain-containing protein [Ruminococcaceae bacterium]|nr:DUF624 domain-containing protein [Oscillospiraceae bacterium]